MKGLKRLAVVAKNPIVYHAPLYREYAAKGNDIEVLYLDNMGVSDLTDTEFKITITWDIPLLEGYRYMFLKNYSPSRYRGFFARINFGLFSVIRKKNYDAILITGYETMSCWFALFVAKLIGVRVLWRGEATLRSHGKESLWKGRLKKFILTGLFKSCDAVLFSCTGNKEYLKYYGVPESKLFPIPCSVDNNYYRNERDKYMVNRNVIRNELGIDSEEFVVLFSARFTERKRPLDLLRAVNSIPNKNITILFVGDGVEKKSMEDYVQKNGIKAVFVGFINQSSISKFYCVADVAVVISDYDPSPKAMNEAMNFELPLVVTNVVGTAMDLVKHGENGYVVEVGDIHAISNHLNYLNNRRELAKEMGMKSYEVVQKWSFLEDIEGIENALNFAVK
jgi:glycosyltransferase involved in cell wall biosynthesis